MIVLAETRRKVRSEDRLMGKPTSTWARTFFGFGLRWSAVGNVHGIWVDDAQPFPWKLDIRVENSGKYMLGFSILHVGARVEWPW